MSHVAEHVAEHVRDAYPAFSGRGEAGRELARFTVRAPDPDALVLAIPRGGLPVAAPLAAALRCGLRPVLVRKLPIPDSPEAGFGAVAIDGTVVLNERLVALLGLLPETVEQVAAEVRAELERRAAAFPGGWPMPPMRGRAVWLVDDGLASGYSMLAAVRLTRAAGAARITVAVPVASELSLGVVEPEADETFALIVEYGASFAVASYYRDFHDLSDAEVRALLRQG